MPPAPPHKYSRADLVAACAGYDCDNSTYPVNESDGTVYLPDFRRSTYAMSADIICSALFSVARVSTKVIVDGEKSKAVRQYIEKTFKTTNGAIIEFRGKELRQDDLTVLLHIISKRSGMATSCELEFSPYTFLREIGRSTSSLNVASLRESLERLRQAVLFISRSENRGEAVGFVSEFRKEATCWTVQIDCRIISLFNTTTTYLSIAKRKKLSEGLQTWLYGYVKANKCRWAVPLELIHTSCGSDAKNMKEFARSVRDALQKLAEIGVVNSESTVKNGKVEIYKV